MLREITEKVQARGAVIARLRGEIAKVIVGQEDVVSRMLVGLFAKGHILIEGVPGLAKTTAVKTIAAAVRADFKRVQFTPDLLPADILGTEIYNPRTAEFSVKKGPLFNNIILADEINRAPSKVQSALLEAMQEHQITIGDTTYPLPEPFLVMATQNPIEQEGTYPLPEAQTDRFMLKLKIGYPSRQDEREIARRHSMGVESPLPEPVLDAKDIEDIHGILGHVFLDDKLLDYVLDIVGATREPARYGLGELSGYIEFGASPRASIYLSLAARAYALVEGRAFVTPQDIKTIAPDVLRHRIILSYEAEAENLDADAIITRIFDSIVVP